ncbi:MAG: putative zinc-binding metallopeptidase [Hyphomonadaceae bacterium]
MSSTQISRPFASRRSRPPRWAGLADRDLLRLPMSDLDLTVKDTWLETCLAQLNTEISARGLAVKAHAWISNEWFSPDNTPGISMPFYLAHPRLARLERRMVMEVEGGTRRECMRILRHESGHIIQHGFHLHRRRRWQNLFGPSSTPYPNYYRPDPKSRNFVRHLDKYYAQCHPDEDFAETFALWLTQSPSTWRRRYADWPALDKLEYVDELMKELAGEKPSLTERVEVDPIKELTETLGEHYSRKREHYGVDAPSTFDRKLKRIFVRAHNAPKHAMRASAFVRGNRERLRREVERVSEDYAVIFDEALKDLIERCRDLDLRFCGPVRDTRAALVRLLTRPNVYARYNTTRRQWYAV